VGKELNHWLFTSISSHLSGAAAPGQSWKPFNSLWPNTKARPWTADRGKLCISPSGILIEEFFNPGQTFELNNYVCHRIDRQQGWVHIFVRRCIDQHSVPVHGLIYLEAAAIEVIFAGKPVKRVATYPRLSAHSSVRNWQPASTEGFRFFDRRHEDLNMWTGTQTEHQAFEMLDWLIPDFRSDHWNTQPKQQPTQPIRFSRCLV
jgi:hypothetical protein